MAKSNTTNDAVNTTNVDETVKDAATEKMDEEKKRKYKKIS